jgi:uncharacterized integral membrane protein (TIGR00698 family)
MSSYYDSISTEALLSLDSMEGVYSLPVVEKRAAAAPAPTRRHSVWPGYYLTAMTAAIAFAIHYLPIAPFRVASETGVRRPISAAIIAILAGVLIRNLFPVPGSIVEGCKVIVRKAIPVTIVLTGAGLNLALLATVGAKALTITIICIAVATASAYYCGRLFGLWPKTALLIGAGTAICGNSAIVAVAPLIDAADEDVTLSVGTVNVMGLLLMFILPLAGGALRMTDDAFGVWAGSTIHAVPQVVAAAFAYSQKAGTLATLVKLVRVTMLAPFMIGLMLIYARQRRNSGEKQAAVTVHYSRLVPPFVWGFLAVALMNTASLLPTLQFHIAPWVTGHARDFTLSTTSLLSQVEAILLTLAMAAMGLEVSVRRLVKVGGPAILTGLAAMIVVCLASLALIRALL